MRPSLIEIIHEAFGAEASAVGDSVDLRTLDSWDSLSHMMFIMNIERAYAIELGGDDIVDMLTVSSVRKILRTKYDIES